MSLFRRALTAADFPAFAARAAATGGSDLTMMLVDVDSYYNSQSHKPVLRLFGSTREGNSVCVHVHGFFPYFYVPVSEHLNVDLDAVVKPRLDACLKQSVSGGGNVISVEEVVRTSILNFHEKSRFWKITVSNPKLVATFRSMFEKGVALVEGYPPYICTTFESSIPYALRFLVDLSLSGGSWLSIPVSAFTPRPSKTSDGQELLITSTCQLEFDVFDWTAIIARPAEGEFSTLAPLRILSFDIECLSTPGEGFPTPDKAPVIQIAAAVQRIDSPNEPLIQCVFTLDTCAEIPGAFVYSFAHEKDLLLSFREFVHVTDPDVLTGYNILNFDMPYLLDRAKVLDIQHQFAQLSRLRNHASIVKNAFFESKALGKRENKDINVEGRVVYDVLQVVNREFKLRSYSLNAVCAHFLNEQKEDVHYSIMADLQKGTPDTRKRLAVYCLKDAVLPLRLLNKLLLLINSVEMARVTGVPINYLLTRGQMIKVASQLYRTCRKTDYVIPSLRSQAAAAGDEEGVAFEGATVLEPLTAFYQVPIATLDFASLYPSIMIAHNLCYSTMLQPGSHATQHIASLGDANITKTPIGCHFVKPTVRKGILPLVLEELISARKAVRKEMAKLGDTDPFLKQVLNGRQLALKISANSVYGFTGATVGMLPCLEISSSVTSFGREMIEETKRQVEAQFTQTNGYANDAVVVYGDTDSVFVKFGCDSVEEAMRLGEEAASRISTAFIQPIKLEFEKVYFPFLLMNKKRYAGLYWTRPETFDKMDAKGIETVRRDNCELVKIVVETVLDIVLKERSIDKAVAYVQTIVADLLQNKVDLSMLVISKSLAKGADSEAYAVRTAHVELAERMRQRDPSTAPNMGDRVQYVMIKASKGAKGYEKAEDPLFVLENGLTIDGQYYIEHQLKQPLLRLLENVITNVESKLFAGEHTRKVVNMTPAIGGLSSFVQKSLKCLGCKCVIKAGAMCDYCIKEGNEAPVVLTKVNELRSLEIQFAKLWSQCQRCQGSHIQDVLCTSRDCPIFFRRAKVRKDAAQAAESVRRLMDSSEW